MDVLSLLQKLQENEILVIRQKPCFFCFAPPATQKRNRIHTQRGVINKTLFFAFLNTYDNFFA
jgi:hypothetical protein